MMHGQANMR